MATKKTAKKKKAPSKKTKHAKKKTSPKKNLIAATGAGCRECVEHVIEKESGRKPDLDDKMSDLFVPCAPDVMEHLRKALKECSDRNIEVKCSKTVRRIIVELCT